MIKHTPGPLYIECGTNLFAADGCSLTNATGTDTVVRWSKRAVANAERAVACWNACEGIDDPTSLWKLLRACKYGTEYFANDDLLIEIAKELLRTSNELEGRNTQRASLYKRLAGLLNAKQKLQAEAIAAAE